MRIEQEKIDAIRVQSDIVTVIGHFISVQKKGRNYVSVCPFHQDHDPSLSISQEKQIFKCFVCGAGGNVFQFVQRYQDVHFLQAVQTVAEISNISIDLNINNFKIEHKRSEESNALTDLCELYHYQLISQNTSKAYKYLHARGISQDVIDHFKIGFASEDDQTSYSFLSKKGYSESVLMKSGCFTVYNNKLKDIFSNRITFPIFNQYGDTVGFSARNFENNDGPKYINSTDSDVFQKSDLLYHFSDAKAKIQSEKNVYILEGMMDVIALYRVGISNAVAIMGTALTKNHIKMLKKCTKKVTLCLDSDDAGVNATLKAIESLESEAMQVNVVYISDFKDPDDLLMQMGKDALLEKLHRPLTSREYELKMLSLQLNMTNYEDKIKLVKSIMPKLVNLSDALEYDYFVGQLETITGFSRSSIENEFARNENFALSNSISNTQDQFSDIAQPSSNKFIRAEQELLWYMCQSKEACQLYFDKLGMMYKPEHRVLANAIVDYHRNNSILNIPEFLNTLESELSNIFCELIYIGDLLPEQPSQLALQEYINTIKRYPNETKIKELKLQMAQATRSVDQAKIAQEIISLEKELKK